MDVSKDGLRRRCVLLTALGAASIGLPLAWALIDPQPLPSTDAPGHSLDWLFSALFVAQMAVGLALWVARRRPLVQRYALAALLCVCGGWAFFVADLDGLLTEAPRIWLLAPLPLLTLFWMRWRWPDAGSPPKPSSRS